MSVTLLDFARGPAMQWALIIFVFGMVWRLVGVWGLRHKADHSQPRATQGVWKRGLRAVFARILPYPEFAPKVQGQYWISYVFHLGFFIVLLFFVPHILFFEDILGFGWPGLPNNVIFFVGGITVAALIVALIKRILNPVTRMMSNFDDYFAWFVTIAPVATGLLVNANLIPSYEVMLAIHILSFQLLLIYLPFGKLMHGFWLMVSRWTTAVRFARRGGLS